MSLEYQEIVIAGYVNNTDKFGLLVGYAMTLNQPLVSGKNYVQLVVQDLLGNPIDETGIHVFDNSLTQTYVQINVSNGNPKPLLIPPGCSILENEQNASCSVYGMLLLGTLDEIARVAIR